jgi:hypothetical protein
MSHLWSPRAMIWPTLQAIEISSWPAKETHIPHTSDRERGIRHLIKEKMADRL